MRPAAPKSLWLVGGERPLPERTDDELVALAAAGWVRAFEELIRRHQAGLRSYCARVCGSGAGDEVAQEVFLTVWNARADYEPRAQFRAYLFTIAERRCKNALRGAVRARLRAERANERQDAATPLDEVLAQERQRRLYLHVSKLSSAEQRAISLRYAAGLDYEEIAAIVARPAATVRSRVFSALRKLRKLMPKQGEP